MAQKSAFQTTAALTLSLLFLSPQAAEAAWGLSGVQGIAGTETTHVRIPSNGTSEGIFHELDPSAWFAYRVKVVHLDSIFTNGWTSDNFTPTAGNIQVCDVNGCETPSIETSDEVLDWTDHSRIRVFLQAKPAMLSTWQTFELPVK